MARGIWVMHFFFGLTLDGEVRRGGIGCMALETGCLEFHMWMCIVIFRYHCYEAARVHGGYGGSTSC
jgi:hypothetical protein